MASANQLLLPGDPLPPIEGLTDQNPHTLTHDMPLPIEDVVQREWFTYTRSSRSGYITPEIGPEQMQVDETYRANLAVKLQHHVPVSLCLLRTFCSVKPYFYPIDHFAMEPLTAG